MIVCLSVCVAWLLRIEEAWFVSSEDQELRTDSRSRSWGSEDRSQEILSSHALEIKASAGTF